MAKRLGEILVDLKALHRLDRERVLEAMRRRRGKFGQIARDMGLVRDEDILAALAVQMDLFPEVNRMTLAEILQVLQTDDAVV